MMELQQASYWFFLVSGFMVTAELLFSNLFTYFFTLSDSAALLGLSLEEESLRIAILTVLDGMIAIFSFSAMYLIRKKEISNYFKFSGFGTTVGFFLYGGYQLYSGFVLINTSTSFVAIVGGIFYAILGTFSFYLTSRVGSLADINKTI